MAVLLGLFLPIDSRVPLRDCLVQGGVRVLLEHFSLFVLELLPGSQGELASDNTLCGTFVIGGSTAHIIVERRAPLDLGVLPPGLDLWRGDLSVGGVAGTESAPIVSRCRGPRLDLLVPFRRVGRGDTVAEADLQVGKLLLTGVGALHWLLCPGSVLKILALAQLRRAVLGSGYA